MREALTDVQKCEWDEADLIRRLCHALDIAQQAVAWLAPNGYTEERAQHARDKAEAKVEQERKERTPPEFFNMDGIPHPIAITGSQHSVQGPFVHVWGLVTVVNPTESQMKIALHRLVLDGAEWAVTRFAFHLRSNPQERSERLSMVGNSKEEYELHFLFQEKCPKALSGELWLTSSNREDEHHFPCLSGSHDPEGKRIATTLS